MGAVATFSYSAWTARYPEMSGVTETLATLFWNEATLYLDNTGCGPVQDLTVQTTLLNMLTAHIAKLNTSVGGKPATDAVGRVSQAGQGSVSVSLDMGVVPNTAAWYMQTQYGAAYWAASAPYRMFNYQPGRSHAARGPWPWRR